MGSHASGRRRSPVALAPAVPIEPDLNSEPVRTGRVVMSTDGIILDFDPTAEALLGHRRDHVLGRRMSEVVIPERLRAAHEAGLRRFRETGEAPLLEGHFELPALCADGSEVALDLTVTRIAHDGSAAFAGTFQPAVPAPAIPGELKLHADFHRALVEQSPIIVAVLDQNGVPSWRSNETGGLFSAEDGRPVSEQLAELVHPADLDLAHDALQRATTEGLDDPVELRVRAENGDYLAVSILARNLLAHPAVHGTALYASDVTRARAAERQTRVEAARLMTLIESLNVAILLQDEDRRVVLANAAFVEMFSLGITPDRLRGTGGVAPLAPLYADADDVERRTEAAIKRGRPLRGEEIALVDGRVLERDYVPIMLDGTNLGHLWVFRDVTAQAEIRRGLEERARILSELATLKTEFVAVVSHELRTPLTSINTFANMLEDDDMALSADERSAAMTAIRRNADRMLSLVADLILLAKLESGEINLELSPLDVPAVVQHAIDAADSSHVELCVDLDTGPRLTGDPQLISQLVDIAIGVVVAGSVGGAEVVVQAEPRESSWHLAVTTSAADAGTAERLLSTSLPHPDAANERRTGALAVMLARAIAARHGGELAMTMRSPGAALTVDLPIKP